MSVGWNPWHGCRKISEGCRLGVQPARAPEPRRTVQGSCRRDGLHLLHVGFSGRRGRRMARRGVGDDPHAQRPALLLHHQTHRPPDAGPAARLGRRLRESDRGLHSRESGGGRPPASAVAGSAPAPQADRLRTAARTARHRAIPHLRDRGGLRGRRIGQRRPSVRLRLGAFDPPAVSRAHGSSKTAGCTASAAGSSTRRPARRE